MEFRSTCTQPLENTFAPIAFEVGLFNQLEKLEEYLENCKFLNTKERDLRKLRKKYSKIKLSKEEEFKIQEFSHDLLTIARLGLIERGYGEEIYLN